MDIITIVLLVGIIIMLIILLTRKINLPDIGTEFERSRRENAQNIIMLNKSIAEQGKENLRERTENQKVISEGFAAIASENEKRSEKLNDTLTNSLEKLRESNEKKLDEMRKTVGEKLDSTLNERLDSSFKQVSERLEGLYKSFGEIKELSNGVTDSLSSFNRVLTNVKSRGTWAEVNLRGILDEIIPGRYETNFSTDKSLKRVEFAVKIPAADGSITYLPLDSKFPMEDYVRLCTAAEKGDEEGLAQARKSLYATVINEAKAVKGYINPPLTTPFAILYLATEGLYNEILSSEVGTAEKIQNEYSVLIAGPTTISALLNSLAVSFTNIAINEKADEIKNELLVVRKEYDKFAELLEKAGKKITEAGNTIEEAKKKTETIQKKLKID